MASRFPAIDLGTFQPVDSGPPSVQRPAISSTLVCPVCNNLQPYGHPQTRAGDATLDLRAVSMQKVEIEGRRGCHFCGLLLRVAERYAREWSGLAVDLFVVDGRPLRLIFNGVAPEFAKPLRSHHEIELREALGSGLPKSGDSTEVYVFKRPGDTLQGWYTLGAARYIAPHADSEQSYTFVETCLNICMMHHRQQCGAIKQPITPKRLLQIASAETVRLVEPQEDANLSYVTLSHCWGGHQPLKTTIINLAEMRDGFARQTLPRAFQDTLKVAARLKIKHVWIDSLCIVQDDREDWEVESAKMGAYFENAYCTIAATSSANSDESFLCERDPDELPLDMEVRSTGRAIGSVKVVDRDRFVQPYREPTGPLATRAWAYQEEKLARRIVFYTKQGLAFHCRYGYVKERGKEAFLTEASFRKSSDPSLDLSPFEWWHSSITGYTYRVLTFESDKLPALSGMASRTTQDPAMGQYFAGLWEGNFVGDLLWSAKAPKHHQSYPPKAYVETSASKDLAPATLANNRSPSWSWSSVNGIINFVSFGWGSLDGVITHISPLIFYTQVLDAYVNIPGKNPFGEVDGGYVTLRGPATAATLRCLHSKKAGWYEIIRGSQTVLFSPDTELEMISTINGKQNVARRVDDGPPLNFHCLVLCLLLCVKAKDMSKKEITYFFGLVLGLAPNEEHYVRLGRFTGKGDGRDFFGAATEMDVTIR